MDEWLGVGCPTQTPCSADQAPFYLQGPFLKRVPCLSRGWVPLGGCYL